LKTLEDTASDRDISVLVSVGSDFTTPTKKKKEKLEGQRFKNDCQLVIVKNDCQK